MMSSSLRGADVAKALWGETAANAKPNAVQTADDALGIIIRYFTRLTSMSATTILVRGVKTRLRVQAISYKELAAQLGVSEPTVKRDLSRGKFSLERLDKICEVLGVEVNDLIQPADSSPLTELSDEQEQALVANPKLLLVTYLVVNDWKFNEIVSTFQLDENELVKVVLKMDRLRIVDFRPPTRMRKLTSRNFSWRKDGAVHEYFIRRVIPEFFGARFDSPSDEFRFMGGTLAPSSMMRMQASIRRLASEFEQLAHQDGKLPLRDRDGCTVILAMNSQEFSEFSKLRRVPKGARAVP
jgi:DNA-binding Xre family transcriptional regulator